MRVYATLSRLYWTTVRYMTERNHVNGGKFHQTWEGTNQKRARCNSACISAVDDAINTRAYVNTIFTFIREYNIHIIRVTQPNGDVASLSIQRFL
jgi:hypothetical protein